MLVKSHLPLHLSDLLSIKWMMWQSNLWKPNTYIYISHLNLFKSSLKIEKCAFLCWMKDVTNHHLDVLCNFAFNEVVTCGLRLTFLSLWIIQTKLGKDFHTQPNNFLTFLIFVNEHAKILGKSWHSSNVRYKCYFHNIF